MIKNFSKISDLLIEVEETVRKNVELTEASSEQILSGDLFEGYSGNWVVEDMTKYALNKLATDHKENFALNHKLPLVVEISSMIEAIFDQARISIEKNDIDTMSNTVAEFYNGKSKDSKLDESILRKYDITEDVWEELVEDVVKQCKDYEEDMKNNFSLGSDLLPEVDGYFGDQLTEEQHEMILSGEILEKIGTNETDPDKLAALVADYFKVDFCNSKNFSKVSDVLISVSEILRDVDFYIDDKELYEDIESGKLFDELDTKDLDMSNPKEIAKFVIRNVPDASNKDAHEDDEEYIEEIEGVNFSSKEVKLPCRIRKNFSNFNYDSGKFEDDTNVPVRYKNLMKNPRYDD